MIKQLFSHCRRAKLLPLPVSDLFISVFLFLTFPQLVDKSAVSASATSSLLTQSLLLPLTARDTRNTNSSVSH